MLSWQTRRQHHGMTKVQTTVYYYWHFADTPSFTLLDQIAAALVKVAIKTKRKSCSTFLTSSMVISQMIPALVRHPVLDTIVRVQIFNSIVGTDEQNTAAKDDSNSTVSGNNTNNDNANSTSTDASKNNTSSATTTTINNNDESVSSSAAASSSSSSEESNKRTSLAEIKRSADERKGREREEIPFDFHKFLEQMHRRSATPIVKYFKR